MRRSANFAPLSQILVVAGCEALRSETPQTQAESRLRTLVWSQRRVRCDRYGEAGGRSARDARQSACRGYSSARSVRSRSSARSIRMTVAQRMPRWPFSSWDR